MAALGELLLTNLSKRGEFDSLTLASELCIEHEKIVGAVKSLQTKADVRLLTKMLRYNYVFTWKSHMADVICHNSASAISPSVRPSVRPSVCHKPLFISFDNISANISLLSNTTPLKSYACKYLVH